MTIDYDEASQTYDRTRQSDLDLVARFAKKVALSADTDVLDFGCGSGNYLIQLRSRFGCRCYGVEPSAGMRRQAQIKGLELTIRAGNHEKIPFLDEQFDFVYMTDVIHHVPDLASLFRELARVLRPAHSDSGAGAGHLCIVTESHAQIAARFYNRYFPSLMGIETGRYPSLTHIVEQAGLGGLNHLASEQMPHTEARLIDEAFIRNVTEKNYSMFRLLDTAEYEEGLRQIRAAKGQRFESAAAGQSLLWFTR